jgi:hypothetical protein
MLTFDLWLDMDDSIFQFGETQADGIARQLEMIAAEIRSGRMRPDGKFTHVLKNGASGMSDENIIGAYRLK